MNAAATAASPRPARTWNGSCPGPPAPKTSAPGRSHLNSPASPAPGNHDGAATRTGHAGYRHARSQDFRILTIQGGSPEMVAARDQLMAAVHGTELLAQVRTLINTARQGRFGHTYTV